MGKISLIESLGLQHPKFVILVEWLTGNAGCGIIWDSVRISLIKVDVSLYEHGPTIVTEYCIFGRIESSDINRTSFFDRLSTNMHTECIATSGHTTVKIRIWPFAHIITRGAAIRPKFVDCGLAAARAQLWVWAATNIYRATFVCGNQMNFTNLTRRAEEPLRPFIKASVM